MNVTIVDYGLGNLLSVARALTHAGATVRMAERPEDVVGAERLVLPGVGAFPDGMRELTARGLVEPLKAFAASGRPLMGICLGMQMLFDTSDELGGGTGLGLIPGRVVAVPAVGADGTPHKIPHIGWAGLVPTRPTGFAGTPLARVTPGQAVYFVHAFMAAPTDPAHRLADCDYDGAAVCAAVQAANVSGCQFHPEKSGEVGLNVVRAFLELNR